MMAEQRSVSVEVGFTNPDRIRYQWEPKSEVSADIVGATIQFLRLTPSRRTSVHIHWELKYDRDVEQHQLHMLKP